MNHANSNCWKKWRFPVGKSKRCSVSHCSFPLVSRRHAPVVSTLAQRCQKDWNALVVFQIYNTTSVSAHNHMSLNKTSLELFFPPQTHLRKMTALIPLRSGWSYPLSETGWEEHSPPFEAFLTPKNNTWTWKKLDPFLTPFVSCFLAHQAARI